MRSPNRITAKAKINLALHITGIRGDGYHLLDSLVTFADIGDVLQFTPNDDYKLSIAGPEGQSLSSESNNLISQAALALFNGNPTLCKVHISLAKNLPVASGIGGGSADAAATLIGLNSFFNLSKTAGDLTRIGLTLGADVPMCLAGHPLRAQNIGELITPVKLPPFFIVLANPRLHVSTPNVFLRLKQKNNPALAGFPQSADQASWINWLAEQRNDLQVPACGIAPEISTCLEMLEQSGALFVRMSGSGATCFGIYQDEAAALRGQSYIEAKQASWWVRSGQTVGQV